MANPYEIDWRAPDISHGIDMYFHAMNARTQREFAKRNEEREHARELREKDSYERQKQRDQDEAFKSARMLFEQGDAPSALSLLKRHGINATPEIGAPTTTPAQVMTPLDVMKGIQQPAAEMGPEAPPPNPGLPGSPFEGPAAPADAAALPPPALPTPVSIMQRAFHGTQTGTTVPEAPPEVPPVAPPTVSPGQPLGNAETDIMPLTLEPEHTTPGAPTGAYGFKGAGGEDLGRYDPAAMKAEREAKAGRVESALGPMGEQVQAISRLIASGDIDPKEGAALMTAIRAENAAQAKADEHAAQRTFTQGENEKYKSEGLSFEQRKELANIMAKARMAAAGASPVPSGVATLVGMKEAGASDEDIYAKAAQMHLTEKQFTQPVQNVVRNATAGERAGQKREALTATDDTGHVLGVWKDAQAGKIGSQQIERFHRVKERLAELIKDVDSHGSRVLTPDEVQNRLSKASAVVAALRPFNELSNTAAGQKAEELIVGAMGTPGHGFLMGANADILKRLLTEAEGQHQAQLATKLRPGGGSQLSPALGGPKPGQHPQSGQVGAARKWLADNPKADPALRAKVEAKIQQLEAGGG